MRTLVPQLLVQVRLQLEGLRLAGRCSHLASQHQPRAAYPQPLCHSQWAQPQSSQPQSAQAHQSETAAGAPNSCTCSGSSWHPMCGAGARSPYHSVSSDAIRHCCRGDYRRWLALHCHDLCRLCYDRLTSLGVLHLHCLGCGHRIFCDHCISGSPSPSLDWCCGCDGDALCRRGLHLFGGHNDLRTSYVCDQRCGRC